MTPSQRSYDEFKTKISQPMHDTQIHACADPSPLVRSRPFWHCLKAGSLPFTPMPFIATNTSGNIRIPRVFQVPIVITDWLTHRRHCPRHTAHSCHRPRHVPPLFFFFPPLCFSLLPHCLPAGEASSLPTPLQLVCFVFVVVEHMSFWFSFVVYVVAGWYERLRCRATFDLRRVCGKLSEERLDEPRTRSRCRLQVRLCDLWQRRTCGICREDQQCNLAT